ncbi:uncharacterized protein [Dermacentor albipictus]|uniref:uncharacterized protein n=1 Tax=Dermacentor albipictus TaxID=60249 RepID=UPI0031FBDC6F
MAAFTLGLPLLLFVVVVIISYIFIDPSQKLGQPAQVQSTPFPDVEEPSPCQETPEWRECVPLLPNSSYYFDPKRVDCLRWDSLPKGCLNDSNGFADLQQCQQTCITARTSGLQAEQAEQKSEDEAVYDLRQRSQRRSRPPRAGPEGSSNGTTGPNHWFTEPVALFLQQPKSTNTPVFEKLPPKRCQTVILQKCNAASLKPSAVYNPATGTCSPWDYSKGCYRNTKIFFTTAECQAACSRSASGQQGHDCWNPVVGEACDESLQQLQYFFNPLRSSCKDLTDLCLAGRNRFPNYTACAETCLSRGDSNAHRRHQEASRG